MYDSNRLSYDFRLWMHTFSETRKEQFLTVFPQLSDLLQVMNYFGNHEIWTQEGVIKLWEELKVKWPEQPADESEFLWETLLRLVDEGCRGLLHGQKAVLRNMIENVVMVEVSGLGME